LAHELLRPNVKLKTSAVEHDVRAEDGDLESTTTIREVAVSVSV
jgi:hypothetical protein